MQVLPASGIVKMEWYQNRYWSCNLAVTLHRGLRVHRFCGSSQGEVTGCSLHPSPRTSISTVDELETCAAYNLYKMYEFFNSLVLVSSSTIKWCIHFLKNYLRELDVTLLFI